MVLSDQCPTWYPSHSQLNEPFLNNPLMKHVQKTIKTSINLDLPKMLGTTSKIYIFKWWFNGDESHNRIRLNEITNKTHPSQCGVALRKLKMFYPPAILFQGWLWKRSGADPRFCCSSSTSNASMGERIEVEDQGRFNKSQVIGIPIESMGLVCTPTFGWFLW